MGKESMPKKESKKTEIKKGPTGPGDASRRFIPGRIEVKKTPPGKKSEEIKGPMGPGDLSRRFVPSEQGGRKTGKPTQISGSGPFSESRRFKPPTQPGPIKPKTREGGPKKTEESKSGIGGPFSPSRRFVPSERSEGVRKPSPATPRRESGPKPPKPRKVERPAEPKLPAAKEKPEISLEKTRDAYIRAKLESDKNPQNSAAKQNFENIQKTYLKERQQDLQLKLEVLKEELKGKSEKEKEKELRKIASAYLATELKQTYDSKTKLLAEQKEKGKSEVLKLFQKVSEKYRDLSWKEKTAIAIGLIGAGSLVGIGVTAGVIGSGTGIMLSGVIAGTRGVLTGIGSFVGTETLVKKWQGKELEKLEKEPLEAYKKLLKESFEDAKSKTSKGLEKFLQSRDLALKLEKRSLVIDENLAKREKTLSNRRYLIAASVGVLAGLGATFSTFEHLVKQNGLSWESVFGKAEAKIPLVPGGVSPETIVQVAEQHATATVQEGGSLSKAVWQLVHEGKLSKEEMLRAWNNSFVEIKGIQVPIKDVALSHAGDQVVYEAGSGGLPGHFQVMDFAKDKLSLGTNQDLYEIYEKLGKEPPNWLNEATGQNVFEAMKDNNLDANEARNISFWFERGSLNDHEAILEKLNNKVVSLGETAGKDFIDLRDRLGESPEYTKAWQAYEGMLKNAGLNNQQYQTIKNLKVGEFLGKRGRSWWADYFFSPGSVPTVGTTEGVTPVSEILHQRKLAGFLRKSLLSSWEKDLTIEKFLKLLAHG